MTQFLILQHEESTPPALTLKWLHDNHFSYKVFWPAHGEPYPSVDSFESVIILGGSMDTHEVDKHPWLRGEKTFIDRCIEVKKPMFGICLGCQLIAEAIGGSVVKSPHWELGWLPVHISDKWGLSKKFQPATEFAQYHGYQVQLPKEVEVLASSELCKIQAFRTGNITAVQFHPEADARWFGRIKYPMGLAPNGDNIQTQEQIDKENVRFADVASEAFFEMLTSWCANQQRS